MTATPPPPRIVLFDGVCGLCNRLVDWLIRRDHQQVLRFAPLQGETAAALRADHPAVTTKLDTMVFVDDGITYTRMRAVLRVLAYLPSPLRWLAPLTGLPAWLLDPFYWIVASNRYRLFGKRDVCRVPSAEERARFLP